MQALKLAFARRVLAEQRRRRNLQQPDLFDNTSRFYDFHVWTERKRIEKLRYMHRNPVKRGLVGSSCGAGAVFATTLPESLVFVKVNEWQVLTMKVRRPPEPTSRKPRDVEHSLS